MSFFNTFLNSLCSFWHRRGGSASSTTVSSDSGGSGGREVVQEKSKQAKEKHAISIIEDGNDIKLKIKESISKEEITATFREVKGDQKFSYFATGIASAGIYGIYSGYLGNTSAPISTATKLCCFFVVSALASGATLMLLTYQYAYFGVQIQVLKALKYTSFGYLTLSLILIGYVFLKAYVLVAVLLSFLPTLLVMVLIKRSFVVERSSSSSSTRELQLQLSTLSLDSVDGPLPFSVDSPVDLENEV